MSEGSVGDLRALVDGALSERDDDRRADLVWQLARRDRVSRVATIKELLAGDRRRQALGADIVGVTPYFKHLEDREWAKEQRSPAADVEPFTPADCEWLTNVMTRCLDRSRDPDLVYSMVGAVGAQGLVGAAESVARHATDEDEDVREAVAVALAALRGEGALPQPAIQALIQLARDSVHAVRSWALFALGRATGTPIDMAETRAVFTENASDDDEDVREEAIRALALLGQVESLEKALDAYDFDEDLVEAARRAGDSRLQAPLQELLAKEMSTEQPDQETGQHVRDVLRRAIDSCRIAEP